MGHGGRDGGEPLLRARARPSARWVLALTSVGVLCAAAVFVSIWHVDGGASSTTLLSGYRPARWYLKHPGPEQRKLMREMSSQIGAPSKHVSSADKAMVAGLERHIESLKLNDPTPSKVTSTKHVVPEADSALADADSVLAGAPQLVRDVLASSQVSKTAGDGGSATNADAKADEVYKDSLEGYERIEEGMAPREPVEGPSQMEMDASKVRQRMERQQLQETPAHQKQEPKVEAISKRQRVRAGTEIARAKKLQAEEADSARAVEKQADSARALLAQRFKAPGARQELDKTNPEVLEQMMQDMAHPPMEELKVRGDDSRRKDKTPAHEDAKGSSSDKKLIAKLEHKVESLESLNAKLALGNAPPGDKETALKHAEDVAAKAGVSEEEKAEKKALLDTLSVVPGGGGVGGGPLSPALQHAENVARKAAMAAVRKQEAKTAKFLHKEVKVDKLKLLGVKEDRMGGLRHAILTGQKTASKIPGIKEDTWPFGPGSWRYARKKPLPGVKESSWEILPDLEGPKAAPQTFRKHAGGCFPDGKGHLRCHGEEESWMKVKGWDKKRAPPKAEPGTSVSILLPHIRQDAEEQKLDAAAESFSDSAMAQRWPARTEDLLQIDRAKTQRVQALEQVGKQCSNFLDCLAMETTITPQYTHPQFGADQDRIVRTSEQSLSHTAMRDAFNPALRPWRLISKWPFEAGDVHKKMPRNWIGKISRLSASSHHDSHMKYDVPAAELPSDRLTSMYARERASLRGQALAAEKAGTLAQLMSLWERTPDADAVQARANQVKERAQMLANEPAKPGTKGLGVRNYENTVGVCTAGVNCDSSAWPFGDGGVMSDALVDAKQVQDGGLGLVGPWTPMMYTGNKPTSYDPGAAYVPDYQFLAELPREVGLQKQVLMLTPHQGKELEYFPRGGEEAWGDEEVAEADADGDEDADALEEAGAQNQTNIDNSTNIDAEEEVAEKEAAFEAAVRPMPDNLPVDFGPSVGQVPPHAHGEYWSPMSGHIHKNPKMFEFIERPQEHGAHTWHLPGVNVDSGWQPYKSEDLWGYDRRIGKIADMERGLVSAAQDLPRKKWNAFDRMEHSNHTRAVDSLKAAWDSVAGRRQQRKTHAHHHKAAAKVEEADDEHKDEDKKEDAGEGEVANGDQSEEGTVAIKVNRMRDAPSLHAVVKMERDADADRSHAWREEQRVEKYLHSRFGAGVEQKGDEDRDKMQKKWPSFTTQVDAVGAQHARRRKLLSTDDPDVEPKHDDTLNVKFPPRPPAPADSAVVMPPRARGKSKHRASVEHASTQRPSRAQIARMRARLAAARAKGGALPPPNTDKTLADLRSVRREADKLGEGPWSLKKSVDSVVRSVVRHAGDDIQQLVGTSQRHATGASQKSGEHKGKASASGVEGLKDAKELHAPVRRLALSHPRAGVPGTPKMEAKGAAWQAQLKDLNALTEDVDRVSSSDDIADMHGVDVALHKLVAGLEHRRDAAAHQHKPAHTSAGKH